MFLPSQVSDARPGVPGQLERAFYRFAVNEGRSMPLLISGSTGPSRPKANSTVVQHFAPVTDWYSSRRGTVWLGPLTDTYSGPGRPNGVGARLRLFSK